MSTNLRQSAQNALAEETNPDFTCLQLCSVARASAAGGVAAAAGRGQVHIDIGLDRLGRRLPVQQSAPEQEKERNEQDQNNRNYGNRRSAAAAVSIGGYDGFAFAFSHDPYSFSRVPQRPALLPRSSQCGFDGRPDEQSELRYRNDFKGFSLSGRVHREHDREMAIAICTIQNGA
jgi:hypothetical protein